MIPKSELVKGVIYGGDSKPTMVGRWNGTCFEFVDLKADNVYLNGIVHPDDAKEGQEFFTPTHTIPD